MPTPQRVRPGSTPSTRSILLLVVVEFGPHLSRERDVREDVLHIIEVVHGIDKTEQLARRIGVGLDLQIRDELGLGRVVVDARLLQRHARGEQLRWLGDDLEAATLVDDFFSTASRTARRISSSVTPSALVIEMTPLRLKL